MLISTHLESMVIRRHSLSISNLLTAKKALLQNMTVLIVKIVYFVCYVKKKTYPLNNVYILKSAGLFSSTKSLCGTEPFESFFANFCQLTIRHNNNPPRY